MADKKIYNIGAGCSFVDVLAEHFLAKYQDNPEQMAEVMFLLPNRRACQNLAEAFVRFRGCKPTILPKMLPIADVDEDEVFLSGDKEVLSGLLPAVNTKERLFTFARMIMQKPDWGEKRVSLAQAYALAENLASLLDSVCLHELSFDNLTEIVAEKYAAHWQQTLNLLKIVTEFWPQILKERGVMDVAERRLQLLKSQIALWKNKAPKQKIVIAGTTAAFPILKKLTDEVLQQPNGECYIYGLDKELEDEAWLKIGENHPQYELKELLESLQVSRDEVTDIAVSPNRDRERFVSEIMRPAETSSEWRNLKDNPLPKAAFEDIKLVNCDDERQEAKAVALIIRKTLEEKEKTAALVTLDRNLSRRVISELLKWNIIADDSAGQPLNLSPIGIYLRLIVNYAEEASQTAMMALLKHPFTACGLSYADFNGQIRHLELALRRGKDLSAEQQNLLDNFKERISPLTNLYKQKLNNLKELFLTHIKVAESLADTDLKSGDKIIWRRDAGKTAADFVSSFLEKCEHLENIQTVDYVGFFNVLLSEQNVRSRYGMHPRVKILGPIEARLVQYDTVIIGEANEGSWPNTPKADMWMSRPMKKEFGLPQPERNIGVAAADFAHLLNAPKVYVTRAKKIDGAPSNKSRWWLRMETVLSANFNLCSSEYDFIYKQPFSGWARRLEYCDNPQACKAPHPCPPVERRPRVLSATNVEKLRRDPYTIYAKYILSLYPLDELDKEPSNLEFGNFVHEVLQEFNNIYDKAYPPAEKAVSELRNIVSRKLAESNISDETAALWLPRIWQIINWVVERETSYREDIEQVHNEIKGQVKISAPAGDFVISGKADRIDETKDGYVNIIDYKTGRDATAKAMTSGNAPQLPIEGLIAETGGFAGIMPKKVKSFQYWAFKNKINSTTEEKSEEAIAVIANILRELTAAFDNPERAYIANPVRGAADDYSHLSRFLEWSIREDDKAESEDDD